MTRWGYRHQEARIEHGRGRATAPFTFSASSVASWCRGHCSTSGMKAEFRDDNQAVVHGERLGYDGVRGIRKCQRGLTSPWHTFHTVRQEDNPSKG